LIVDLRRSSGFTLIELLVVLAIVAVVLSIAVVGYRHARVRGSETAALSALRSINQAQFAYRHTCGHDGYAPTLVNLGVPPPGTDSAFLSPDLAKSDPLQKSGYVIRMTGALMPDVEASCTGVAPLATYHVTADPVTPGLTGVRYFGTNTERVIYADSVTYLENMPETGAPGHGAEIK
jgi:prepilin-type N-terminal cleavage/methylation domain-containing protein